ncbi:MAG TPA: Mrp/NBP35 family ATP-binding protein [Acholeplasmataceae bacterium]|nr:Mrp/NBP35 family ATP-binding protein [Acholeplasmataceae bacterium]
MTAQDIRSRIEKLIDPSQNKTLKELNAIKHIGVDDDLVVLIITIGELGGDAEKKLRRDLAKIIKLDLGFKGIKIQFEENRRTTIRKAKFIIIASGKGGVGKSYITANLAYALRRQNKKVGIIDCDIYGSSIPHLLEMEISEPLVGKDNYIIPFKKYGIEVMSTAFFAQDEQPVIWRGSMLKSMITSFFEQVKWSHDLEFVLIDAPTGTGDVMIDLKTLMPSAEVILVSTPNEIDTYGVIKAGNGYKELRHNIIGIIENKSYVIDPKSSDEIEVYKRKATDEIAEKLDTEIIATIPFAVPKFHLALYESGEEVGEIFDDLATLLIIR